MLMVGSRSFSLGTSIQFISMAPGSPGEHGVSRSSTILPLFMGHSPRTWKQTKEAWNSRDTGSQPNKDRQAGHPKKSKARPIHTTQTYWKAQKGRASKNTGRHSKQGRHPAKHVLF